MYSFSIVESIFACTPATSRGQAVQLGIDPKGENFLYTNGKTVFIRNLAVSYKSLSFYK